MSQAALLYVFNSRDFFLCFLGGGREGDSAFHHSGLLPRGQDAVGLGAAGGGGGRGRGGGGEGRGRNGGGGGGGGRGGDAVAVDNSAPSSSVLHRVRVVGKVLGMRRRRGRVEVGRGDLGRDLVPQLDLLMVEIGWVRVDHDVWMVQQRRTWHLLLVVGRRGVLLEGNGGSARRQVLLVLLLLVGGGGGRCLCGGHCGRGRHGLLPGRLGDKDWGVRREAGRGGLGGRRRHLGRHLQIGESCRDFFRSPTSGGVGRVELGRVSDSGRPGPGGGGGGRGGGRGRPRWPRAGRGGHRGGVGGGRGSGGRSDAAAAVGDLLTLNGRGCCS